MLLGYRAAQLFVAGKACSFPVAMQTGHSLQSNLDQLKMASVLGFKINLPASFAASYSYGLEAMDMIVAWVKFHMFAWTNKHNHTLSFLSHFNLSSGSKLNQVNIRSEADFHLQQLQVFRKAVSVSAGQGVAIQYGEKARVNKVVLGSPNPLYNVFVW